MHVDKPDWSLMQHAVGRGHRRVPYQRHARPGPVGVRARPEQCHLARLLRRGGRAATYAINAPEVAAAALANLPRSAAFAAARLPLAICEAGGPAEEETGSDRSIVRCNGIAFNLLRTHGDAFAHDHSRSHAQALYVECARGGGCARSVSPVPCKHRPRGAPHANALHVRGRRIGRIAARGPARR